MKDFEYARPASLAEAVELLSSRQDDIQFLAGGTDILVQLREGQRVADLVVDVKKIPELMEVAWSADGSLRLGAAVPCIRLYRDARIRAAYPALTDAARIIGGWQIQSRATIGGNLCNSSPAADSIPALIAHDAGCRIAGPRGERSVPVASFCTGPGRNTLERGEFLVSLEFPPPAARSGAHYLRFIPRNEMDIAVAGAGAWLELDAAGRNIATSRIGLAAVAPTPVEAREAADWLHGKPATEDSFASAARIARQAARPIDDLRGPAAYRLHLVEVLTRRALSRALERASSN